MWNLSRKLNELARPAMFAAFLIANHSAGLAALPVCALGDSDSDGDGYGWENSNSCIVAPTGPAGSGAHPSCTSAISDTDNDGYGWENGRSCIVGVNSGQPQNTRPDCSNASFDSDGDGYGWENGQSCNVTTATPTPLPPNARPVCQSSSSDSDGDGYGWEQGRSCTMAGSASRVTALSPSGIINTGTPVFRWSAIDAEAYRIVVSDSAGNGYTSSVDAVTAGCQGGIGTCSYTPGLSYFDNHLSWVVQPIINGQNSTLSNRLSITTPFSPDMQPILSNTGTCEAWPAIAYDNFVVLNNSWNSRTMNRSNWSQKINVDQDMHGNIKPTWTYDWLGRYDGGEIEVKAYPEVIFGSKLGTHVSGSKAQTGLPELVRNLPEFTVTYAYSETGTAERNVALESFFHDSCNITGPCDPVDNRSYEMMIWVNNPTIRTPGDLAVTGVMIDNQLWNVYIKPRSNKHYIAFTAQTPSTSGTLHWNRFVEWTEAWTAANATALSINVLSPDFCMGAIELGTEMWWGSGSFTLDRYEITHQEPAR